MSRFIPEKLRTQVAQRAGFRCEYCKVHQDDLLLSCQIDHIISLKHNGETESNNLAFSCLVCNVNKGSDIGSLTEATKQLTRFFNPRTDNWSDHFYLNDGQILPKTPIGQVTSFIFQFNTEERVLRRQILTDLGTYPSEIA